ncbi:NAD(P)-binding domain-containing protein [Pseudoflavitalea sp. X16]|uniref:NADPH-dependent F420 reductase n=1 Tax=Paraflavitalea devenefica TaxID=2716334 RepID=UPI00142066FB|nr:NAD(P)-binding domain-containing protein [Paraflavitalea devenefica]NII26233.1 NAD(P)-binding domain-containing protein [Paraflavitalea devenefica]
MKIGIIGAGSIGMAFAKQATNAGFEVILSNSRGPASLTGAVKALGSKVKAGTVEEAAAAEVVFVSLQWQHLQSVLSGIKWKGQIIIDPANPILPGFKLADLYGKTSSEVVATWANGATVVKAFNTLTPSVLGSDPHVQGGSRVIFYSGNNEAAKQTVSAIIKKIGFAGVDLGRLDEGGKLQQFPGGPLPTLNLVKMG